VLVQYTRARMQSLFSARSKQSVWASGKSDIARQLLQLQPSLAGVAQWLAAPGTVQQLTALGYQPHHDAGDHQQQQLSEAEEAMHSIIVDLQAAAPSAVVPVGESQSAAEALLQAAQEQLQAATRVLACFAIPHACSNAVCKNLSGLSEAQLVSGHSCICAGCRTARYCGRACQCAAWRQHKPVCKALAAAAAAAAAAGVAAAVATSPAALGEAASGSRVDG
jgi:hypothetical protein